MLSTVLATAAAGVLLAVIGAVWKLAQHHGIRVWRALAPDHRALNSGPWREMSFPPDGPEHGVRIRIVCAPARSFRRNNFDLDAADSLARTTLGEGSQIAYARLDDGVRAERNTSVDVGEFLWLCANGKVDLSIVIPTQSDGSGRRELGVLDVLGPVAKVHQLVNSETYRRLHGLGPWRRWQRFDWRIGVSMYSTVPQHGSVASWDQLLFPGAEPRRLVERSHPFCPPNGYAIRDSRGRPRWPVRLADMLAAFLTAFLAENGYNQAPQAVRETVADAVDGTSLPARYSSIRAAAQRGNDPVD